MQQICSAISALGADFGRDNDEVIIVTHDVLVPALVATNQDAAVPDFRRVSLLYEDKSLNLAAIQCMRNIALWLLRQGGWRMYASR